MKKLIVLFLVSSMVSSVFGQKKNRYPITEKVPKIDTYFEDEISDPYQWMESSTDPKLVEWLKAQDAFTKKIANKQTRLWDLRAQLVSMYQDVNREIKNGYQERNKKFRKKYEFDERTVNNTKSRNLYFKTQNQSNYKLLINAKDYLNHKNDKLDYASKIVSQEHDLAVITLSINGSDWKSGHIFNLKNKEPIPYVLKNLKQSNVRWFDKTLYFDAYDTPAKDRELLDKAKGQKLYKLEVGKDSIPELIYTNPDTTGTNPFRFTIKDDKLFLFHHLESRNTTYRVISCADLNNSTFFPRNFIIYPNEENLNLSIAHTSNDSIWLKTNWNAPNGKILLANLNTPNKLTEFVPEYDIFLKNIDQLGENKLALTYFDDGQNTALIYDFKGTLLKKIDFPKGKKLNYFHESESVSHTDFYISSFFHPDLRYQISLDNLELKPVESVSVPYNVSELETRYVSYSSADGTEISMYITCKKDVELNGENPVILYGYGGYGTVVEPFFSQSNALFIAHGGILAVPNIRGGGAKGSLWASEGRRLKKQNAIDDFIGAAQYLIDKNYTQPKKMLISGASHGGLLVTAAMTQRPKLFKAVIAEAGPYDMLRFNKFTVGGVNSNLLEFGNPETKEDYENLRSYSPLHNIKKDMKYPNVLLVTGNSDDRVPPLHSYKFLATLQEKADPSGLYALYVTKGAGHRGTLTQKDFEDLLLFKYYFIFDNLGIKFY